MGKHLIGNKTAGVDYSKINSMWDVLVTDVSAVQDMKRFTQEEKDFVVDFLAGTLDGLTNINTESRRAGDGFIRMCDAREVLSNLDMLYGKHVEDDGDWKCGETKAEWTFTLEDARQAIEIVHNIRNAKPIGLKGDYHPYASNPLVKHPFKK